METLAGRPVGRVTEAEYDRERARLRELYGDSARLAAAKRDQALARLFVWCGWTQEELGRKEGKSQSHIAKVLRFGRFLTFSSTELNSDSSPNNLSEGRFRAYWERTDKHEMNERIRFATVQRLMAADIGVRRSPRTQIRPAIIERFGDGEWHSCQDMAAAVAEGDEEHVISVMSSFMDRSALKFSAERRRAGKSFEYRLIRADGEKVAVDEIRTKLGPLIKGLIAEGKKNMATMSPGTVAMLAARLERQLLEWTA